MAKTKNRQEKKRAVAEFIFIVEVTSRDGNIVYEPHSPYVEIRLVKENGSWKVDYKDEK